jgi:uncharacterized protein
MAAFVIYSGNLHRRLRALTEMQTAEKSRLDALQATDTTPPALRRDLQRSLRSQRRALARLSGEAYKIIQQDPVLKLRFDLLVSAHGSIAATSAIQILAELAVLSPDFQVRQWVAHAGLPTSKHAVGLVFELNYKCWTMNGRLTVLSRIERLPWSRLESSLWLRGYAKTEEPVLTVAECTSLRQMYSQPNRFRSRVEMERYRFGVGDYQYFDDPLPEVVQELRTHLYPFLAPIANRWTEALGLPGRFPSRLTELAALCRQSGQTKPTPLLLHYEAGGYNCLHQDIYGELVFPFQALFFLSEPDRDYTGGEFLLVEQRPRAQSIGEVVRAGRGEMVIFTTRYRPVKGARGYYRANVKHGVSRIKSGTRYTLGIIFHDAR